MRKSPADLCRRARQLAIAFAKAAVGEMQRSCGVPITVVGTHRQAVEQWKESLRLPPEPKGRVLITALRNRSWIGFGVYAACVLRQKGYEPTLLYRSSVIEKHFPSRHPRFSFWRGVADIQGLTLIDLDAIEVTQDEVLEFEESANASASSVLAYDRHVEEQDVRAGDESTQSALRTVIASLMRIGAATKKHLTRNDYHRFILYSGLIGESPIMLEAAHRLGVDTVCLEGWAWRSGHMIYNYGAPALDYDIAGWLKKIQPWSADKDGAITRYVNFLDGRYCGGSTWLDDLHLVQRAQIASTLPPALQRFVQGGAKIFLAAPNVIGDSSMLRRETIFLSQQEWCAALISFFKTRPDAKLIIRAHPAEIWCEAKVRVSMAHIAKQLATHVPNVFVIDADEPLNTFTLLPFVSAGLVWLSSVGVDMVVRGVPAITAAKPKYCGLGIVEEPSTKSDYFTLLDSWLAAPPRPSDLQVLMAKQYLYILFKGFSFEAWSRNTFATGIRLNDAATPNDHDAFYKALIDSPTISA